MEPTIEIIGVYPLRTRQPVYLIEILVRNAQGVFDVGKFTQAVPDKPASSWQAPYDEKLLDPTGERVIADGFQATHTPDLWTGDMRMTFFFHFLDLSQPLRTPFGELALPATSKKPRRLAEVKYVSPD